LLTTAKEKAGLLAAQNVDYLIIIPFTLSFAQLTAADFLQHYLREQLSVTQLVMGYNQRIGSDGASDFAMLKNICNSLQINVLQSPPVIENGVEVSSTKIRRVLNEGNITQANRMLGYPYALSGTVVHGKHKGHKIGFPTANLDVPANKLLPPDGVYAVKANVAGARYGGMLNIGCNPTLSAHNARTIEVHLFDFQQDIYGKSLTVSLVERLRDEQKFTSLQALQEALQWDESKARALTSGNA
jgi:riboflavin kinase/FMN adenylyltransferase